jgi:hypothetical protein
MEHLRRAVRIMAGNIRSETDALALIKEARPLPLTRQEILFLDYSGRDYMNAPRKLLMSGFIAKLLAGESYLGHTDKSFVCRENSVYCFGRASLCLELQDYFVAAMCCKVREINVGIRFKLGPLLEQDGNSFKRINRKISKEKKTGVYCVPREIPPLSFNPAQIVEQQRKLYPPNTEPSPFQFHSAQNQHLSL